MQLSKEEYARKRIHNGFSVQIENSDIRVTGSTRKLHDAEQLPEWRSFQSAPHNH